MDPDRYHTMLPKVLTLSAFTQTDCFITGLPMISPCVEILKCHKEVQVNVTMSVTSQECQTNHEKSNRKSKASKKRKVGKLEVQVGSLIGSVESIPVEWDGCRNLRSRKVQKLEVEVKQEAMEDEDEVEEVEESEGDLPTANKNKEMVVEDFIVNKIEDEEKDLSNDQDNISETCLQETTPPKPAIIGGNLNVEPKKSMGRKGNNGLQKETTPPKQAILSSDSNVEPKKSMGRKGNNSLQKEITPPKRAIISGDLNVEPKKSMWRKGNNGNFCCLLCDWSKPTSKSLVNHLRIHLNEKPYICSYCGKGFRKSDKLRDHERTHTGEKPFPCDECSQSFRTKKGLHRHKLTHADTMQHQCTKCDRGYRTRDQLKVHIAHKHEGIHKHTCSIDGCTFSALEKCTIQYHEAEKHGQPYPTNLMTVCDICGVSVRSTSIRMHQMTHEEKSLICQCCDYRTQYKNTLRSHMQRIHGIQEDGTPAIKSFSCSICTEQFFSNQELQLHILRHKGSKPHKCPICEFSTVDKGSLKMHIRTHTGERPFSCPQCPKSFKQSSSLSWHVKTVHQGVRQFRCEECDMSYINKRDLKAHRYRVHLKVKPYACFKCEYACTKKEYLAQHIRNSHGEEAVPKDLLPVRTRNCGPQMYDTETIQNLKPRYIPEENDTTIPVNMDTAENAEANSEIMKKEDSPVSQGNDHVVWT